ncbi:MAG TPA: hypothetical protein VLL48_10435, partial [Longimicrobiales bacterium]|nr:hypothetical protein [Longimicrobiales bacterium]
MTTILLVALAGVLAWTAPLSAQADDPSGGPPTLTPDDYERWESLGGYSLDPTGTWLVASVRRGDGSTELRLHRADGSGEPVVLEHGIGPAFSDDGRWMLYRKGVSPEEREESDEPDRNRLGLVDLASGADTVLMEISAAAFRDDGAWLAARGFPASDSVGADLTVFRPGGESLPVTLGNVDDWAWQDEGPRLAVTLRTASGSADGVLVFDPATGEIRTLDSGEGRYRSPTWREGSAQLAVFRSVEDEGREDEAQDLLLWDDVEEEPRAMRVLASAERAELGDT